VGNLKQDCNKWEPLSEATNYGFSMGNICLPPVSRRMNLKDSVTGDAGAQLGPADPWAGLELSFLPFSSAAAPESPTAALAPASPTVFRRVS
jgi:hypothetical protein